MKTNAEKSLNHIKDAMSLIPANAPGAMLVRHAERPVMPKGHHGNDILLTQQGERDSFVAGELMRGRIAKLLHSSVKRCRQTAEQMRIGAGSEILPEMWIGLRCDSYVVNFELAVPDTLTRLVSEDGFYDVFVKRMSESGLNIPYPHFKPPLIGAGDLMRHLLSCAHTGICVGVTHDWLINVAVSYASGKVIARSSFADYLDALFVWKANDIWMFSYKDSHGECASDFSEQLERRD